jgi:MFS family permease
MSQFSRLWSAATVSYLGDGMTLAAGPLLAATLTRDPVQIAGLMVAERLPSTLLALPSGAVVDRVDRRRLMTAASLVRVLALGSLGLAVAAGHASLPLLYLVMLAAGCAAVLFENAGAAMLPETVGRVGLDRANGRIIASRTLGQSLIGAPLAGWLFALTLWVPFVVDAAAYVLVGVLCLTLSAAVGRAPIGERQAFRTAIAQGVRFMLAHRLLRTVAIAVAVENVLLGAVFSIMVLISNERLGVGPVGYGLLLSASAVGGILGGLLAGRITALIGPGTTLRIGLVVEALCYLAFAFTRVAWLAGVLVGILGLHLVIFSTLNASMRQSIAPPDMLGRVHSAYRMLSSAGMLAGAALGGVTASAFGLTAPFWIGCVTVSILAVGTWRILTDRAFTSAREAPASPPPEPNRQDL